MRGARFFAPRSPGFGYSAFEPWGRTEMVLRRPSRLTPTRNTVFVAGGQPSITYVKRSELRMEDQLRRAIAAPNQIVSLSGPTKCGKTVLCKQVLTGLEYVWIEGGQISSAKDIWEKICYELNFPNEISVSEGGENKGELSVGLGKFLVSTSGSHLKSTGKSKTYKIDSMAS